MAVADGRRATAAETLVDELSGDGRRASAFEADMEDPAASAQLVDEVEAALRPSTYWSPTTGWGRARPTRSWTLSCSTAPWRSTCGSPFLLGGCAGLCPGRVVARACRVRRDRHESVTEPWNPALKTCTARQSAANRRGLPCCARIACSVRQASPKTPVLSCYAGNRRIRTPNRQAPATNPNPHPERAGIRSWPARPPRCDPRRRPRPRAYGAPDTSRR
jgi:hypothetical protein